MKLWFNCSILSLVSLILCIYSSAYSNPTIAYDIDLFSGSYEPSRLTIFKSRLFFSATDETRGRELWMYNTVGPPTNVADINPGSLSSSPYNFMVFNSKLYFSANDGINGAELWAYDGVSPPTMVTNINPETCVEEAAPYYCSSFPGSFTIFNSKLYFHANDGTNGSELWSYDSVNPPAMVAELNLEKHWYEPIYGMGSGASYPSSLTVFNAKLYFRANDGINGTELWVYDGVNLPAMVDNICPSLYFCTKIACAGESYPRYLTVFDSKLYFQADDGTNGAELWVYDEGSPPTMVANINTFDALNPRYLTVFDSNLYFRASDGTNGGLLWVYKPPRPLAPKPKCVAPMLHLMLLKK